LLLTLMLLCFMVTNSAADARTDRTVMTSVVTRGSADDGAFDAALGIRGIRNPDQRDRYRAAQNNRFHLKIPSIGVSVKKILWRRLVPLLGDRR
jgi:hypothetical protein